MAVPCACWVADRSGSAGISTSGPNSLHSSPTRKRTRIETTSAIRRQPDELGRGSAGGPGHRGGGDPEGPG
jgi:hypothetical protein